MKTNHVTIALPRLRASWHSKLLTICIQIYVMANYKSPIKKYNTN